MFPQYVLGVIILKPLVANSDAIARRNLAVQYAHSLQTRGLKDGASSFVLYCAGDQEREYFEKDRYDRGEPSRPTPEHVEPVPDPSEQAHRRHSVQDSHQIAVVASVGLLPCRNGQRKIQRARGNSQ